MRPHIPLAIIVALTAINVGVLTMNMTTSVRADVAGMDYRDLRRDRDFEKAVRHVVARYCSVSDENVTC